MHAPSTAPPPRPSRSSKPKVAARHLTHQVRPPSQPATRARAEADEEYAARSLTQALGAAGRQAGLGCGTSLDAAIRLVASRRSDAVRAAEDEAARTLLQPAGKQPEKRRLRRGSTHDDGVVLVGRIRKVQAGQTREVVRRSSLASGAATPSETRRSFAAEVKAAQAARAKAAEEAEAAERATAMKRAQRRALRRGSTSHDDATVLVGRVRAIALGQTRHGKRSASHEALVNLGGAPRPDATALAGAGAQRGPLASAIAQAAAARDKSAQRGSLDAAIANARPLSVASLDAAIANATQAVAQAKDGFWLQLGVEQARAASAAACGDSRRDGSGAAARAPCAAASASGARSPPGSISRRVAKDGRVHVAFDGGDRELHRQLHLDKHTKIIEAVRAEINQWWETHEIAVGDEVVHPWRGVGAVRMISPNNDERIHVEFVGNEMHRYRMDSWFRKIRRVDDVEGIEEALSAFRAVEKAKEEEVQARARATSAAEGRRSPRRRSSLADAQLLADRSRARASGAYRAQSPRPRSASREGGEAMARHARSRTLSFDSMARSPRARSPLVGSRSPPHAAAVGFDVAGGDSSAFGLELSLESASESLSPRPGGFPAWGRTLSSSSSRGSSRGSSCALGAGRNAGAAERDVDSAGSDADADVDDDAAPAVVRPFQPTDVASEVIETAKKALRALEYQLCGADVRRRALPRPHSRACSHSRRSQLSALTRACIRARAVRRGAHRLGGR